MNNKGFSLVELIAIIAILGLLAIITTPAYDIVSDNIKKRNYQSKKTVISKNTIEYVENYLKDKVYDGEINILCFSPRFLIQNGIIASDDEKDEFIENDITDKKYSGTNAYISITYNNETRKLITTFIDDDGVSNLNCSSIYS